MRIFITGNAGAGKTTLARSLGPVLNLPIYGLDRIVWRAGWQKTPSAEKQKAIDELIDSSDDWLIEGVSQSVMRAADTIIFLDVPRSVCLWQCMKRNSRYLFKSREELPEHCPEILILPELLRIIWNFPEKVRPSILNHIEQNRTNKLTFVLRDGTDHRSIAERLVKQRSASQINPGVNQCR
jgi:adenylate kinase family enzyme